MSLPQTDPAAIPSARSTGPALRLLRAPALELALELEVDELCDLVTSEDHQEEEEDPGDRGAQVGGLSQSVPLVQQLSHVQHDDGHDQNEGAGKQF